MRTHQLCRPGRLAWWCGGLVALLTATLAPAGDTGKQQAKLPPPGEAAQAKARAAVKRIFQDSYAEAQKSDAARRVLALKVFNESRATREDPVLRYIGYLEARDLAASAGDLRLAFSAIDELNKLYVIDAAAMRIDMLQGAAKNVQGEFPLRQLTEVTLRFVSEAVAADRFDAAQKLLRIAEEAAIRSKSLPLLGRVKKRAEQVEAMRTGYQNVQPALVALKKNPDNADANQTAGRYFCLTRGSWEKGLPLLARGKDGELRKLARRDLATPKDTREQMTLAEDWAALHKQEKEPARAHLLLRAVHWYRQALDKTAGLTRRSVETEIKLLLAQVPPDLQHTPPGLTAPLADVAVSVQVFNGHGDAVLSVAFAPDGHRAASASWDRSIRVWDLVGGREAQRLEGHSAGVEGVAWSPDGRFLLSCGQDGTVRLWDVSAAKELRQFSGHNEPVFQVAFSPDGLRALTAGADGTVRLWDVSTGNELAKLTGHRGCVNRVAFSPDGRQAVSGGADDTVRLWDLGARKELKQFTGHTLPVWSVAFSPEGDRVASASNDHTILLWEVATGKEVRRFRGHKGAVVSLAFASDGRKLVSGGDDGTVRIWDVDSGRELRQLNGHNGGVYGLAVAPDGQQLLSGSMDRSVRLWGASK